MLRLLANALILCAILAGSVSFALALPTGPTITTVTNSTMATTSGTKYNVSGTVTGANSSGGYLFTINLDALTQNAKWKAYLGNVTG